MRLFPYKEAQIETDLNVNEVIKNLKNEVEESTYLPFAYFTSFFKGKSFVGSISDNSFKLYRSKYPEINGTIEERNGGSLIKMCFTLTFFTKVILIFFSGFSVLLMLLIINSLSFQPRKFEPMNLTSLGLCIFIYLYNYFSFNFYAQKATRIINNTLTKRELLYDNMRISSILSSYHPITNYFHFGSKSQRGKKYRIKQ